MADKTITVTTLGPELAREVRDLVQRSRGRDANPRRKRIPQPSEGGGCDSQDEIWDFTILGTPNTGTLTCNIEVNAVDEPITFNVDDDATDFATALATHSEIAPSDIAVTGGPLPSTTMRVRFQNTLAETSILPPTVDFSSLGGGSGLGVIISRQQVGHA